MKVVLPFVRSPDNYDRDKASDDSGLRCMDPSLAKQSFAEEADINNIVRRFNLTGQLPDNVRAPTYADYEGIFDFHSAMNAVAQAGEAFDAMPAAIRARFNNSPADFVAFCSDEANRAEAEKLGLVFKKELSDSGSRGNIGIEPKEGSIYESVEKAGDAGVREQRVVNDNEGVDSRGAKRSDPGREGRNTGGKGRVRGGAEDNSRGVG